MEKHRSFCPLNLIVEAIGDKWSLLILRDIMFENKRHFRQLLQSEEKIASNILTDRLNTMEREGLLTKQPDPDHKQKVIYSLTQKSLDLMPLMIEAIRWSLKYEPVDKVKHKPAVDLGNSSSEDQELLAKRLKQMHGI
ncbi:MAG TPA: helix-turn-helix domain-containing protein [Mucilaginibacter sp.]